MTWLGLLTFVVVYNQFQKVPGLYPAHITHLLEADMIRIVRESGLRNARIVYSNEGRVPYTGLHWPGIFRGRRFSYNLMLVAIKP